FALMRHVLALAERPRARGGIGCDPKRRGGTWKRARPRGPGAMNQDVPMQQEMPAGEGRRTRAGRGERGGAAARRAARGGAGPGLQLTYIRRTLPPFEVLSEEGLSLIEANADTVLEEVG